MGLSRPEFTFEIATFVTFNNLDAGLLFGTVSTVAMILLNLISYLSL